MDANIVDAKPFKLLCSLDLIAYRKKIDHSMAIAFICLLESPENRLVSSTPKNGHTICSCIKSDGCFIGPSIHNLHIHNEQLIGCNLTETCQYPQTEPLDKWPACLDEIN